MAELDRLSPEAALRRAAACPVLAMLHGGGTGWSWLVAGGPELLREAPDPAAPGTAWTPPGGGWSLPVPGAFLTWLPYEWPAVPAAFVQATALACWAPGGPCQIIGIDLDTIARLKEVLAGPERPCPAPALDGPLLPAWDGAGHAARVDRIKAWIAAGDIYQANLALPWRGRLRSGGDRDCGLFLALVEGSPAPFAALFRLPGRPSWLSHSPECFLAANADLIRSCPIKGTRRRLPGREAEVRAGLLAAPKDRAELAMIVDLVRNDLGRTALAGSVRVAEPAALLDLPHLHHLVAEVQARPRRCPGALGPLHGAVAAAFPAGSITGAPKIRAMQIIRELEDGPRGAYCGAHGWLRGDALQLAVSIRTLQLDGDALVLHAGGGVVTDSDGAAEWDEARAKAAGMAAALGVTV